MSSWFLNMMLLYWIRIYKTDSVKYPLTRFSKKRWNLLTTMRDHMAKFTANTWNAKWNNLDQIKKSKRDCLNKLANTNKKEHFRHDCGIKYMRCIGSVVAVTIVKSVCFFSFWLSALTVSKSIFLAKCYPVWIK